ncbi:PIG-X [Chaetomium strumarium]|uniref:Protein PBN1 n=1 Tax=Chaetomium strumarium TaxID=1170767 RepID=A0AAJ0LYN5_9PEZI|nr:PIG-X [Chaetomium strumarium]
MRERITYVQKLGDSIEPSAITIEGGTIRGPEIHAALEDRLTIALRELPLELQVLLGDTRNLHIRWVSKAAYDAVSPLLARLPPGFHLFTTPGTEDVMSNRLCTTLSELFGDISCSTPAESFTSLPRDTSTQSTAFQYFQALDSLSHFIDYAKINLCPENDTSCSTRLDSLIRASSLDISYDAAQHVIRLTALWPYQRQPVHATSRPQYRTEVGILSVDKPKTLEAHEVGISGLLTVLGQDSKPSPTMFSFASRHRDARSSFSARFLTPTGLHPTLQLLLSSNQPPSSSPPHDDDGDTRCSPYAYLTLPRIVFADKYQLSDPLYLTSKNLTALRYITQPVDLEAPEYVMQQWGSAVLVELSPPPSPRGSSMQQWTAEIPLHLRYLTPAQGGYSTIDVPYPVVFWACEADEGTEFPPNPFEKANLGYDGLFNAGTVFWHVKPQPADSSSRLLVSSVRVPVLDLGKASWVNTGTAVAVMLGFVWVVWKLVAVYLRGGHEARAESEKKSQ